MPDDSLPALVGADLKADLSRIVVGVDFARLAAPEPIVFTQLTDLRGTIRLDHPTPKVVPFTEIVERMTALFRPVVDAFRTQFEAVCTAIRPLADYLAEHPEILTALNDPNREREPEGCHHLCGRDPQHECLGDADGTFAYREGGRQIPMCAPCRTAAGSREELAEVRAAGDRQRDSAVDRIFWGMPLEDSDANWPDDNSNVCAHVCGGDPDHACDARAATQLTYDLPSGGTRAMPVCRPCFNSEWAAKQRYQLVSEGELVRLDCKECPETLLRVPLPIEEAHDAIRDACAEHDRLRHAEASPAAP